MITNFQNGILATPNLGGSDYAGLFGTKVWFVDGDNGSDSGPGSNDFPFQQFKRELLWLEVWTQFTLDP